MQAGVRVRIIGNLSYLPQDLRDIISQVEAATKDNNESVLNIALSYTSREEMTSAVRRVAAKVAAKEMDKEQVSMETIEEHLYTAGSPNPDLMIRTSGETRLSDFMLWQASKR